MRDGPIIRAPWVFDKKRGKKKAPVLDLVAKNRERWQEPGMTCGWTDTGICAARISAACRYPYCRRFSIRGDL